MVIRKELFSVNDSLDNKKAAEHQKQVPPIKACKKAIGVHLQFALNLCIKNEMFPIKMKRAYETPILKTCNKLDSTNCQTVSVAPSIAKNFECLLMTQMTNFIDNYNFNTKEQF